MVGRRPPHGLNLLQQIYAELYHELGEDYSPKELLSAAQHFIDAIQQEREVNEIGSRHFAGYFSYDTDIIITNRPWLVYEYERRIHGLKIDVND